MVGARLRRRLGRIAHALRHEGLAELLEPAIDYAEQGFPVSEIIAGGWQASAKRSRRIGPTRPETYLPDGTRPPKGEIFRNPNLAAQSIGLIAKEGRDAFYKGAIAAADRRVQRAERRLLFAEGFCRSHVRLGRAGLDQLSRLRRVGAAAQRPGDRGPQMLNMLEAYDVRKHGAAAAPIICTCSSRPRSWPSPTGPSTTPTRISTSCRWPS